MVAFGNGPGSCNVGVGDARQPKKIFVTYIPWRLVRPSCGPDWAGAAHHLFKNKCFVSTGPYSFWAHGPPMGSMGRWAHGPHGAHAWQTHTWILVGKHDHCKDEHYKGPWGPWTPWAPWSPCLADAHKILEDESSGIVRKSCTNQIHPEVKTMYLISDMIRSSPYVCVWQCVY